jgi:hypothetical protein
MQPNFFKSESAFNAVLETRKQKRHEAQAAGLRKFYGHEPQPKIVSDLADFIKLNGTTPERLLEVFKAAMAELPPEDVHKVANNLSQYADHLERIQTN